MKILFLSWLEGLCEFDSEGILGNNNRPDFDHLLFEVRLIFSKIFFPRIFPFQKKLHFFRRPNSSSLHKKFFSKILFSVVKTTVDTRSKKKIKWPKVFSSLKFSGKPKNSIFINYHRTDYFRYKFRSRKSMLSCSPTISYRIFRKIF